MFTVCVFRFSPKQRRPAWCDRILYMVHEDAFDGLDLRVQQHCYTSLMPYWNSDHKPVVSELEFKVCACVRLWVHMFIQLNTFVWVRCKFCTPFVGTSVRLLITVLVLMSQVRHEPPRLPMTFNDVSVFWRDRCLMSRRACQWRLMSCLRLHVTGAWWASGLASYVRSAQCLV